MAGVIKVFFRGLIFVCATIAVVAVVWTVYIQREALASALLPQGGLVDRLRGVSEAPDSATAAPLVAPSASDPGSASTQAPPPGAPAAESTPAAETASD